MKERLLIKTSYKIKLVFIKTHSLRYIKNGSTFIYEPNIKIYGTIFIVGIIMCPLILPTLACLRVLSNVSIQGRIKMQNVRVFA